MQYNTPVIKQNGFVVPGESNSLYNEGNDDIATINRFAFPAISFSPSFPLSMSLGGPRVPSNTLTPPSPPSSVSNVLSPRSAHRGSAYSATSGSSADQELSKWSPSPSPSSSLLSAMFSLDSPLPPLSPRGQKLADAEKHHQAKCLNRFAEKRRKSSDGTQDIIEPTPVQRHTRKVSFNVLGQSAENASMLPSIVQGKTTSSDIPTVIFTQFGSEPCELEMKDVQIS